MYRHTKASWENAPVQFENAHFVKVSKATPVEMLEYQHEIEDLTPFDCDVYWKTIWCKCTACHKKDMQFRDWIASACSGTSASASDDDEEIVT